MRKEPKALGFDEFADELLAEKQPRALVILVSAKIDLQLGHLMKTFLLPKAGKEKDGDELLDGDGPLSTFSARIKMCHRLGLIDDRVKIAIDKLRDIRNQAAHWIYFGVLDAPLRDQLKHFQSLMKDRRSYTLTLETFFGGTELNDFERLQAMLLTLCVLVESIQATLADKCLSKKQEVITLD